MDINTIKAGDGKVFRRISDGIIYDKEITLGYTFFINGEKLTDPYLETAEDFEEIDISELESITDNSR